MKKIIYHGDNYNTTALTKERMFSGNNQEGIGVYFSTKLSDAKSYGKNIIYTIIDTNNFLPSREIISDVVNRQSLEMFLKDCLKLKRFYHLLTDYGIETDDNNITPRQFKEFYSLITENEVRNFQIEITQNIGIDDFLSIWKKDIKKQGTYHENWYALIYGNIKKYNKIEETIIKYSRF